MTSETATLFQRLTRGAHFVIGAAHEDRRDIFAAASVMQASHTPLLLAVGVNPRHASYPLMRAGRIFAVSVIRQEQIDSARRFGAQTTRDPGKLDGVSWHCGRGGVPIVDDALAYFECEMSAVMPAGDHEIIVGRVIDCRIPDGRTPQWSYSHVADADRGLSFQRQPLPAV
jgi:flavin reductase (DIM6/NTAB) family NADH-FMN oxidoreductase RutF